MLKTSVYIYQPNVTTEQDVYSLSLYFKEESDAKYLNVGDYLEDTINNKYEVVSAPLPYVNGATLRVRSVNNTSKPLEDLDYNSWFYTPEQLKYSPEVQTAGEITFAEVFSSSDYEYVISASWEVSQDSNKAVVGDSIVDANGKEFTISYIDPVDKFKSSIRVKERHKTGDLPIVGASTLYRSTSKMGLFQGTKLPDKPHNVIKNTDSAMIDIDESSQSGEVGSHNHDDRYYTKDQVDTIVDSIPPSGGVDRRKYWIQTEESPDGARTVFTIPGSDKFVANTLIIFINGLAEKPVELTDKTFEVQGLPLEVGDVMRCNYTLKI